MPLPSDTGLIKLAADKIFYFLYFFTSTLYSFSFVSDLVSSEGIMSKTRSEDVLGEKWDRCLADTGVKMLGGNLLIY